jgi:ABC-type sugar transport system ATPase subunit
VRAVDVTEAWKYVGATAAVANLRLTVADGSLVVPVGHAGCGKTRSLRLLAGLGRSTQ